MKRILLLIAFTSLAHLQILPQNTKHKKTDLGKVLKGFSYLGLSAGTGYLALKSYEASKGKCTSKFTVNLILNIHDLYKLLANKKPLKRNEDPMVNLLDDLLNDLDKFPQETQERKAIAKLLSGVSGCASLIFCVLGLKNLIQA